MSVWVAHVIDSTTVPVELSAFSVQQNNDKVILNWETATETNNYGFEIQRSNKNSEFITIGFVAGYGTTTEKHQYSYSDELISDDNYRYRLKQVDYDGSFSYSDEKEINFVLLNDFALYQNYPNPFNPSTTIKFALPEKANLVIAVYNLIGEKVAEVFKGEMEEGYHEVEFNAANLPSGVYFYRFESDKFNTVKKMVIMK